MAKRFTSTEKWDDAWFADRLTPAQRTAWQYLCDKCDLAGVADISVRNAALFVGNDFDWEEMVRVSEGRIERLHSGKLHLTGFVEFQYGQLNENCNAHRAVLKALDRHGLLKGTPRDGQPFPTPSGRDQDKDKDKDKDKDLEGGVGETKPKPRKPAVEQIPLNFSLPLREKVAEWLRYKSERRESYKPTGLKAFFGEVANVAKNEGESVVLARMAKAMANGWRGWNHPDSVARGSPADDRQAARAHALKLLESDG